MAANSAIRVTDINFSDIKANLRTYLRSQKDFTDYDFESSTMSLLLDILAYNTYMNAFHLNMVGNETFLDSAQLRNNVVSRAKMLGYTPRGYSGAQATLQVNVTPDDSPTKITVAKDTAFTTSIDGKTYKFVVPETTFIQENNGVYSANVAIRQGEPLTHRWNVSTSDPDRYVIPNKNVDTSSITISIQDSSSNTSLSKYIPGTDISSVNSVSQVFFINENEDNKYEVYFGDGVFGKKPRDGNIVIVDYRIAAGTDVNGANNFTATGNIGGYSTFTISTASSAAGGANQESIDSIKYGAPKLFEAQGRLVTNDDYKAAILNDYGSIESLTVWGGEQNTPPVYGKVYIAMKPVGGSIVADDIKDQIKEGLRDKNVLSIEPVFVDPTYLYIVPTITVRYNPNNTSLSPGAVATAVANRVITFEQSNLGNFDTTFYHSRFVRDIDNADRSILGTEADIVIQKRFVPITTTGTAYNLAFNNQLSSPHPGHKFAISSSAFTIGGKPTAYYDDDGHGNVRSYWIQSNSRAYISTSAGTVDYSTGLVRLNNQLISAYQGDEVKVNAVPKVRNIFTSTNQILLIADTTINVVNDATGLTVATLSDISTTGQTAALLQTQSDTIIF